MQHGSDVFLTTLLPPDRIVHVYAAVADEHPKLEIIITEMVAPVTRGTLTKAR
jgi:predicted TIM-barrel fold metal-dependent hydrolase